MELVSVRPGTTAVGKMLAELFYVAFVQLAH